MKFDQRTLEIHALAHLVSNPKAMDKFLARGIKEDHFSHVDDGMTVPYPKELFKLAFKYWTESGGSLLTDFALEHALANTKYNDRVRGNFMVYWQEVLDYEINENDLHSVVSQLKDKKCLSLLGEMLTDGNEKLSSEGLKSSIASIEKHLDNINNEMAEFSADIQTLDVSESAEYFEAEYLKRVDHPELFQGIPCGLENIDSRTFGWLPGQIIVFLAPSSGGKSVFLLNSAIHANTKANKKVLYMSFEMNSWLCMLRHISLQYEIPYSKIKNVSLEKGQLKDLINKMRKTKEGPYFEYDVNMEDPTPEYIDTRIRELIATKGKPDLLVVDYIGNMTVRNPNKGAKDYELQNEAIKQLFRMAKKYNIPIITAQQINREGVRDARKAKEANKFMSYDQAAVSGGQVLLHLCTYAIAIEPNKEENYCILHPVKMRDAFFAPFPVRMEPEFNKMRELSAEEQLKIMAMHAMSNGQPVGTKEIDTSTTKPPKATMPKIPSTVEEAEEEEFVPLNLEEEQDMSLDLSGWKL